MYDYELLLFSILPLSFSVILFPSYTLSNTLNFALFDLLFISNSSSEGKIGFLVTHFPFDTLWHTQTGKSFGQVHGFSFFLKSVLTILSSKEWNVMIHSRPFGFNRPIISSNVFLRTSNSWFNSIRIA